MSLCFQGKIKMSEKEIWDAASVTGSAPTHVHTEEEKALFATLAPKCLDNVSGRVDFVYMAAQWNAMVLQTLGQDRKPLGNLFYKQEVHLQGYNLTQQKKGADINRILSVGGGPAAYYKNYQAPMMQADIGGNTSSAQSSGASTVGGREQVGAFAHAGAHLRHDVVPVQPMYSMMAPPPSTYVGAFVVPPPSSLYRAADSWPPAQTAPLPTLKQIRQNRQPNKHKEHICRTCKIPMLGHKCPGKLPD
jgi:hypothetical protein